MSLIVLIGLPGVGKSTWAREHYDASRILSSDQYRIDMFGDVNDQSRNGEVFELLYADMDRRLAQAPHEPLVFDATNLNAKRRQRAIELAHKHGAQVKAVVFVAPLNVVLERNSQRERVVPEDVIRQKYRTLHVPLVTEGWDDVVYVGSEERVPVYELNVHHFVREIGLHMPTRLADMDGFNQHNPHHTLDLYDHTMATYRHLRKHGADWRVQLAALYHDVGKLDTQTFDESGVAHYYGHQYVSTQIAIQELTGMIADVDLTYVTTLIHYHMDLYNHKTAVDVAKFARRLGNAQLFHDLILLHEADSLAH